VVTNAGSLDKTEVYLFDGHKIIETRDGSNNMVQQSVHGTRYIDEHVMMRVADKGDLYVHQDANWNVIGATDLGGSLVERYEYSPYGQVVANQETGYGDRDGDGDVDADDKGTPGTTCTGTLTGACRILDLDFDGDYDSTDGTKFDSLPQGNAAHPGRHMTGVSQHFGHQGLLFEAETAQYQNRARQYGPGERRFAQPDPLRHRAPSAATDRIALHVYLYEGSSPIRFQDPSGLYSTDVHYSDSKLWAEAVGYPSGPASFLAAANDGTDGIPTGPLPAPLGDQSRHFDRSINWGWPEDSRAWWWVREKDSAKVWCLAHNPTYALMAIGRGLHSKQDWWAHGMYYMFELGQLGPQHKHPDWYDVIIYDSLETNSGRPPSYISYSYEDFPPYRRLVGTTSDSQEYLRDFRNWVCANKLIAIECFCALGCGSGN